MLNNETPSLAGREMGFLLLAAMRWRIAELDKLENERKRTEETLRMSEDKYRLVIKNVNDAMVVAQDGRLKFVNLRIKEIFGYEVNELTFRPLIDFIHPDDREMVIEKHLNRLRGEMVPPVYSFKVVAKDGTTKWAEISAVVITWDGRPATLVYLNDITGQKRKEEELIERERFNFALFEFNPIQTVVVDSEGKVTHFNLANKKSGDRLPNIGDVMYRDYAGKHGIDMYAEMMKCIRSGETKEFLEQKYGNKVLSIQISPFTQGAVITSQDITERKKAEEALRESEERYRSILDNIEEGYFEVDLAGNYTFFNDSLCRQLGYSKAEMMGMNNGQYMDKETAKRVYQAFNRVYTTGEPYKASDWEVIRKDGTKRIHESSFSLMRNAQGERIGFRGVTRDITERKRIEEGREKLVRDLQKALAGVKKLSGYLPICASCKKIDDKGSWRQIEAYIRDHSEAEFSHSICPDCAKKLYGDILGEKGNSSKK